MINKVRILTMVAPILYTLYITGLLLNQPPTGKPTFFTPSDNHAKVQRFG